MKERWFAGTIALLVFAAGCGGGGAAAPAGWQQDPKAASAWHTGDGASAQTWTYVKHAFGGTLQDLASREATDVVLRNHGAKFASSDVFGPCPGQAALIHFTLPGGRALQEGIAVLNGQSVEVSYARPASASDDPAALQAMERALCTSTL